MRRLTKLEVVLALLGMDGKFAESTISGTPRVSVQGGLMEDDDLLLIDFIGGGAL